MSLDVYLIDQTAKKIGSGIFVRENGQNRELTREEWDARFPGLEPVVVKTFDDSEVYSANITHNLNKMADAAGIYEYLWRPDEIGIKLAKDLIEPLTTGLEKLRAEPETFRVYNPSNGWGTYEGLIRFVEAYLEACKENPEAEILVSR